ncbi:MAG: flagellar motor switch protein FliN [Chlamydiia bacterium]|nr:flagellar motor switch protein FliN [Chlamydiia bacterium]
MDDLSNEEVAEISSAMVDEPGHKTQSKTGPVGGNTPAPSGSTISRAQFMQLEELAEAADLPPNEVNRMHDIQVKVEVILGRTKMTLEQILHLHSGSVVELNKLAGEPVDIVANDKLIARAEVVVIEDNFGIKILEIVGTQRELEEQAK